MDFYTPASRIAAGDAAGRHLIETMGLDGILPGSKM
jgi:hypothetical protein